MKIQSTANVHQTNLKCLIFGKSGIGKTSLAKTLSGRTLIISAESGLVSLHGTEIDFVDLTKDSDGNILGAKQRIENLGNIYKELLTDEMQERYDNIFVDSLTEIADVMKDYLEDKHPDPKDSFKKWGEYSKRMSTIIRSFRDLPHYNAFFTCLESETQDDTKLFHYSPSISGTKVKESLEPLFDELFRFAMIDGKRKLITTMTKSSSAKDRSGKLDQLEEPDLQNILNKIQGEKK